VTSQSVPVTFLLGAARSGTSLLYKALCLHPDAAYFNNWMRRAPRLPAITVTNRLARLAPDQRRRAWFGDGSNAYVYARRRPLSERLFPMPVEGEPVFAACGIPEDGAGDMATDVQARALRRMVRDTVVFGGGRAFVNKRIANNRRIRLLSQIFPSARFVVLTRDGRAAALSLSRVDWWESSIVWWYGGTPEQWREEGGDPWELCARNWLEEVRIIDAGIGELPSERVHQMTYEEFIGEPLASLQRVAHFAGLRSDAGWDAEISRLRFPNRNETWRAQLPPEVIERVTAVQGEELDRRGYR
jgi:hypothetical protein